MSRILLVVALVGCGQVVSSPHPGGGSGSGSNIDPEVCTDPTSIDSCGDACTACPATDRVGATCDGVACGTTCNFGTCSDGSCARLAWGFDDGTLDGITARLPTNLSLSVRDNAGNSMVGIDVIDLTTEVSFIVPICLSGTVDISTKTLTARVMFEVAAATGPLGYVQMSAPDPQGNGLIGAAGIDANTWTDVSASLGQSSLSSATPTVTFQAGSNGSAFTGTLWFDDITIQ